MRTKNLFRLLAMLPASVTAFVLTFVLAVLPMGKVYAKNYDWQSEYIRADIQGVKIGNLYYDLNTKTHKAAVVFESHPWSGPELGIYNYKNLTSVDVPATVKFQIPLQEEITYDVVEIGTWAFHHVSVDEKFTHLSLPSSIVYIGRNMLYSNSNYIVKWWKHGGYFENYLIDFNDSKDDLGLYVSDFYVEEGTRLIANSIIHGATIKQIYFPEGNIILSGDIFYLDSDETSKLEKVELWGTTIDGYFNAEKDALNIYNYDGKIDYTLTTCNSLKKMYVTRDVARYHTTGNNAKWRDKVELFRFKANNLCFELLNKNEAVVVYDDSYSSMSNANIPAKVTYQDHTFAVTKIDAEAFKNSSIVNLTIPSSIKEIGEGAFSGCTKLANVTLANEITTISKQAFYGCTALKELHLNNVANIASEAFKGCTKLTTLFSDYKGVINAHSLAFDGLNKGNITLQVASSLVDRYKADSFWKDFNIASNRYKLEGIWYELSSNEAKVVKEKSGEGNYAELTGTVTIPKDIVINNKYYTVTSIEVGAFQYAPFKEMDIRCQVTVLPEGCCFAMPNLTKVSLPNTLVKIDDDAFNTCQKLENINDYGSGVFNASDFPNLTTIGNDAFFKCRVRQVSLTGSITTIGESAFQNCTRLEWVDLGEKVKTIGKYAFSGCTKIEHLSDAASIPQPFTTGMLEGVSKSKFLIVVPFNSLNAYQTADGWKDYKFTGEAERYYYDGDKYFRVYPDNATMTATIAGAGGLDNDILEIPQEITLGGKTYTVVAIKNNAFYNASIKKIILPATIKSIGDGAFSYSTIEEVDFGQITGHECELGMLAFSHCGNLKEVWLSGYMPRINKRTFVDCTALEKVTIPGGVKEIGEAAFENCAKLKDLQIGSDVTTIGDYAFHNCSALSSLTIPESVTSIGGYAFAYCTSLYEIYNLNGTPQTISTIVFQGLTLSDITLYVPPTRKDAYEAKDVWKNFNIKEAKAVVDGLYYKLNPAAKTAQLTFDDLIPMPYASLSGTVTVPATITYNNIKYNVKEIGNYAFQGNKTISHIVLPEGLVKIGWDCFEEMTALASINIPSTVTSIGRFAVTNNLFTNDYLYTKNGLLIIDNCQIKAKTTIGMNVEVEDGTRLIAAYAFLSCKDLRHLILPNSITDIGEYAFKGCTSMDQIDLPEGLTVIRRGTFQDSGIGGLGFKIPDSVTEIERDAFGWGGTGCNDLRFIRIPESVRKIGSMAFWKSALQLVWLPAGVEELGDVVFGDLAALQELHCFAPDPSTIKLGINVFYNVNEDAKLYVPYGSKALYETAEQWSAFNVVEMNPCIDGFYYILDKENHTATVTYEVYSENDWYVKYTNYENLNTQSWSIPGKIAFENEVYDVKAVSDNAFKHTNVKQIIFSEGIESIGEDAMSECSYTGPEEIRLPSTLTSIGMWAFSYSTDNLKTIYNYAVEPQDIKDKGVFNNELDKSKVTLYVPYGCADKYKAADEWRDFDIEEMPVCVDGVYYSLNKGNRKAFVVAQYKDDASNYADLVRDILVIPSTITVDGKEYEVTSIDSGAFENCKGVRILSLPEGLEKIWDYAFLKSNFEMITLPSTLTLIVDNAFVGCKNLAIIRNFSREPLAIDKSGYPNITLQVPAGCKAAYEEANFWKDFNIQEMAVCIDGIYYSVDDETGTAQVMVDLAARGYIDLGEEIVIPETVSIDGTSYTVTSIMPVAFMDNTVLKKITLPSLLANIGTQAFSGCTALRTIINNRMVPVAVDATVFEWLSLSAITMFVHREALNVYKETDVWKEFGIVSIETPIMIAGQPIRADQYGKPLSGIDAIRGEVVVTANAIYLGEDAFIGYNLETPAIELYAEGALNTFFISGKKGSSIWAGDNAAIRLHNSMTLNINTAFDGDETTEGLELTIESDSEDGAIAFANGSEVTLNINSLGGNSTNTLRVNAENQCLGLPPSAHCDIHAAGNADFVSNTDVCPIGYFTSTLTLHSTTMVLPFGGEVKEEGIFDAFGNDCFRLRLAPVYTQSGKPYPVDIAGMTVTDGNMADVLGDGKASYEPSTNTLTLNDANIVDYGQVLHATAGLRLEVKGENDLTGICGRPSVEVQGGDFVIFGTKEDKLGISGSNGVQCDETEQYRMEVKRCNVEIYPWGGQFALQTDSLCVNAANLTLYGYGSAPAWLSWNTAEDGGLVLKHANKTYGKVNADELIEFVCQDPLLFKVDVAVDDETHGTVTGGGWFEDGTEITLTATAKEGFKFVRWDDDVTDNPRILTVTDDLIFTAVFEAMNRYTVTFVGMNGAVIGYDYVYEGQAATAPEVPEVEGYTFVGWDKDFSNVTSDMTVTAIYESAVKTYSLKLEVEGSGKLYFGKYDIFGELTETEATESVYNLPEGTQFILIAKADEGWAFVKWSDGVTKEKRNVTVTSDLVLKAIFTDDPDGIHSPTGTASGEESVKIVRNGKIYILRGDKIFTVDGREVTGKELKRQ